ncbi:hypothetical protein CEUSTIGMA_g5224.t1 [Chlamydomonas eustigma]|uniref:J domain-containing protein n=1 Tax=Chlamydomonas eustigma TaxID=1157962 RepID=A0A250X3Z1_9CHLO|nr:hypothetical protein CEUSTIGMA_g5224.t1 [Chlamydomonas eustigma]|eukprot:GAX77781.1 hypothetical protein CEUSTIGMA_g5224.t1 [Chlamydomonas eustigma]
MFQDTSLLAATKACKLVFIKNLSFFQFAGFSSYSTQRAPKTSSEEASSESTSASRALKHGVKCIVADFGLSQVEAAKCFERFQKQQCYGFQVQGLIKASSLSPAYIPFWSFSASLGASYTYKQHFPRKDGTEDKGKSGLSDEGVENEEDCIQSGPKTLFDKKVFEFGSDKNLQIYASYILNPDLARGAIISAAAVAATTAASSTRSASESGPSTEQHEAGSSFTGAFRDLTHEEASSLSVLSDSAGVNAVLLSLPGGCNTPGKVPLQDPVMPQGLAWHLALQGLTRKLREQANATLHPQWCVKEMHVDVLVHNLSAVLVFVPVYLSRYQYGTRYKQGTAGVIVPHFFDVVISGIQGPFVGTSAISATPHISPLKAGMLAAAIGSAAVIGGISLWTSVFGAGSGVSLLTCAAEAAVSAILSYAYASSWARGLPQEAKNRHAHAQAAADRSFYSKYDQLHQKGVVSEEDTCSDGYLLWLWSEADWRRWEGEEPWNWNPAAKQVEAESLWQRQLSRPLERLQYRQQLREAAERLRLQEEEDMQFASSGEAGMGGGSGSSRYHGSSQHNQGWRQRTSSAQYTPQGGPRRIRDFLGYYKILGVNLADTANSAEGPSTENVKAAFKAQAMQLHPDKFISAAEEERKQAHVKFQKLQMAYDVLRDPEKRRMYDKGQLIQ